jgi:hypothetical protein
VLDPTLVCGLPLDGGWQVHERCAVRADDVARVVGRPVRACLAAGARGCAVDEDCCAGRCLRPDGAAEGACGGA